MKTESNPAERLYQILSKVKSQSDRESALHVWAKLTGSEVDQVSVTRAVVELYLLSQDIQSLIKRQPQLTHALYLSGFGSIDSVFFPLNLQTQWNAVKAKLPDTALQSLEFCADHLSKICPEELLTEEDITELVIAIDKLEKEIEKSGVPDEVRLILLEEVERMRHAVSMYKIKGVKGLKDALQSVLGSVIINEETLKPAVKSNEKLFVKLKETIDKFSKYVSKAEKVEKALDYGAKALEFIKDNIPT